MFVSLHRAVLAAGLLAVSAPAAWAESNGVPAAMLNSAPPPVVTSGSCTSMTLIDHKEDSAVAESTTSSAFVNVPNGDVKFTQGIAGCAVATFSASSFAPGINRVMYVEAVMDGITVAPPGQILFSGDDDENSSGGFARAHAYTFVFTGVTAGVHTIAIKYRSSVAGAPVNLSKHTVIVTHW